MVHPRDRYRKEADNTCLEISIALLSTALIIFLSVFLIMAISHISSEVDQTSRITSEKNVLQNTTYAYVNTTSLASIKVPLKKVVTLQKENMTFYPINIETSSKHKSLKLVKVSLSRKGRYAKRKLVDLDDDEFD